MKISKIRAKRDYCTVVEYVSSYNQPLPNELTTPAFGWMKESWQSLVSLQRYGLALEVARSYIAASSSRVAYLFGLDLAEWKVMIQKLADSPDISCALRAKAFDLMASKAEYTADPTGASCYEARAIKLYTEAGHAHGSLDILLRQACSKLPQRSCSPEATLKLVDSYLDEYEKQDYIFGRVDGI